MAKKLVEPSDEEYDDRILLGDLMNVIREHFVIPGAGDTYMDFAERCDIAFSKMSESRKGKVDAEV